MPTVDLHGIEVTFNYWTGSDYIVTDVTDVLNDTDTTDAITIPNGFSNLRVVSQVGNIGGYELWTPPAGSVVTKVQYVIIARANTTIPGPGDYGTIPEPDTLPFFQIDTTEEGGVYAIDGIPAGTFAEVVGRFERSPGSNDLNRLDIRPVPDAGLSIELAYLAKRVTYESAFVIDPGTANIPVPTRMYPRDDNRGISATNRIYPPPKANRIIGGYP